MAAASGRVVVSVDTDFGELLAVGAEPAASVVLIRRAPHRPTVQAGLVLAALAEADQVLMDGAVVVVTPTRVRVRRFPLTLSTETGNGDCASLCLSATRRR